MTRYEIERSPGDNTAWFRVVAIDRSGVRRPYLTRFRKLADVEAEMARLRKRDALLLAGAGFPRGAA
jgi:hypothetical protein